MDCSTPSFPVFHQLPELAQTYVHWVHDVIHHFILCGPLLLLRSIFPSIRVFSNKSVLRIRWPKFWSFSFSISPSNDYSGLISFRIEWFDLLVVQGPLKSLLQHHSSKHQFFGTSALSLSSPPFLILSFPSPPPTLFLPSSLIMAVSHPFTLGTGLLLLPMWVVATSSQVFSLPISPSCNFSYPVQPLRRPSQDHTPERSHSCNMTSLLRCVSVLPLLYRSTPSHRSILLSMVPSLTSHAPAFFLPGLDCMPMCPCAHTDTQHDELFFPAFYRPSSQSESLGKEMDECLRQEELKKTKF